jgi:hypothetical protein
VLPITQEVPGATVDTFDNYKDAFSLYCLAFDQGQVHHVVRVGGIYDQGVVTLSPPRHHRRLSGTSSIWGQVLDIDYIAAQWSG